MAKGRKTGGRQAGTPNKISKGVRDNVIEAFDRIGGMDTLAEWAGENLTEFYRLYAKLLPTEISGPGGGAIIIQSGPVDEAT